MRVFALGASMLVVTFVAAVSLAEAPSPAKAGAASSPPARAAPPAAPAPPSPPPAPAREEKKHGSRAPGALTFVLGASGLASGVVFGSIATVMGANVRKNCVNNVCPASQAEPIGETKAFQNASYAAFIAGGIIAAAGLVLIIVAPGDPERSAHISPWVSPGSLVASGATKLEGAAGVRVAGTF
jgi:hypothetical protein